MKDKGPFRGRRALRIKGLHADKTHKLSIDNTELRNGDDLNFDDMVENPEDKFCVLRLHDEVVKRYQAVDKTYQGRVFRRAVKKNKQSINRPNMTRTGVLGHNQFVVITKHIAHRTGMLNPEKCTPAARRRAGITKLANKANGVSESIRMRAARHRCPVTHGKYQEMNDDMMAPRYQAFLYKDSDYGKFNCCLSSYFHLN